MLSVPRFDRSDHPQDRNRLTTRATVRLRRETPIRAPRSSHSLRFKFSLNLKRQVPHRAGRYAGWVANSDGDANPPAVEAMTHTPEDPSDKPVALPAPPEGQPRIPHQQANAGGYPQPAAGPRNGLGTVSLAIGVVALLFSWLPVAGLLLGIGALATGVKARGRVKRHAATNNGVTIAGIVLGTVATIIGGAIVLFFLIVMINYQECIGHAQGRYEYSRC
jgi:hypothetical protein